MNRWLGITIISSIMLFPLGSFPISAAQEFTNSTGTYLQDGDTVTLQTWANGTAYTPPLPPQPPSFVQLDENDYQVGFDLQYLDPMAYTLVESGNTISIINKGVSGVYDKNTCSISIFDADMENELSKESWTVHQAAWGSDNWANISVNNAACETGFVNDNDTATIQAVKQNDDGIFVVTYVFDMYGVKTTVSYTNHDQSTFGGFFNGEIYGSPAKFGFVQSFADLQINVPIDDGFTVGGNDFTFDQDNNYEYLFLDSSRLLWGINNDGPNIYIDFKNVKSPTQYGSSQVIDPHITAHPNPPTNLDADQTELLKIDLDWDAGSTVGGFSDDGWASSDDDCTGNGCARIDTTNENIEFKNIRDGTNDVLVYDFGSTIDDDDWVLHFTINGDTTWDNTGQSVFWVGMSNQDESVGSGTTTQTQIGIEFRANTAETRMGLTHGNPCTTYATECNVVSDTYDWQDSTDYYMEIIRSNTSDVDVNAYTSASDRASSSNAVASTTYASASATSLQYFRVQNLNLSGWSASAFDGYIKDVKFWDATTSTSGTATYDMTVDQASTLDDPTGYRVYEVATGDVATATCGSACDFTGTQKPSVSTAYTTPTGLGSSVWDVDGHTMTTTGQLFPADSDWTLSTWFLIDQSFTSGHQGFIMDTSPAQWEIQINHDHGGSTQHLHVGIHDANSNFIKVNDVNHGMSTGQWYNFVLTQEDGNLYTYLNDNSHATPNTSYNTWDGTPTGQTWRFFEVTHEPVDGKFMETAIWNKVLTAEEITALYNSGDGVLANTLSPADMVAYYDGSGYTNEAPATVSATTTTVLVSDTGDTDTDYQVTQTWGTTTTPADVVYSYTDGEDSITNCYGQRIVCGGILISGSGHDLVGETINQVTVKLSNNGGSPTGDVYVIVSDHHASSWQSTNTAQLDWLNEDYVFNTSLDATTLTSTATEYTFGDGTDAGYEISNGDMIIVYYGDGSGLSATNSVRMYEDNGVDTSDNYGLITYTGLNEPTAWERSDGITTYMKAGNPVNSISTPALENLTVGEEYTHKVSALNISGESATDGWSSNDQTNSWIDSTNKNLLVTIDSSSDIIYYDLGSAVSDTEWTMRYKVNWNTNEADTFMEIGLSDTASTSRTAYYSSDALGSKQYEDGSTHNFYCHRTDGGSSSGSQAFTYNPSTDTDYYFEVSRSSSTDFSVKRYSDDSYSSVSDSCTATNASGVTDLRYLAILEAHGSSSGDTTIIFDDIKIWDGTVSGDPDYSFDFTGITTYESDLSDSTSFELQDDLAQPTGLTAQSGIPIVLDWDDVSNVVTYNIYRDDFTTPYATGVTSSTYSDSSASAGTTYEYKVAALGPTPANNLIGPLSSGVSGTGGVSPDPPTSLTATITDSTNSPLDVDLSWTTPGDLGTGTLSGYKIVRDSVVVHTTSGSGTTYTDTLSSTGTFSYTVRAVTNHGDSTDSNSASVTTVNPPSAISDLAATVITDVRIDLAWSEPSTDNPITNYYIFRDSTNIQNTTSTSYSDTGLTSNTEYYYNVFGVSNVGTSANSNTETKTTYTTVSGSISTSTQLNGVALLIDPTLSISGTPTPTFTEIKIYDDGVYHSTQAMGNADCGSVSDCVIYHFDDGEQHSIVITATDPTHWDTPTIESAAILATPEYEPTWDSNNVAYNVTRNTTTMELIVNRDIPVGWDLTCEYQTAAQAMTKTTGTQGIMNDGYYFENEGSSAITVGSGEHVYVSCTEDDDTVLVFTSYGPNVLQSGINLFNIHMEDYLGVESAAILFVVFAASLFGGRSAPTGILVVLALIGVLGFVGFMTIEEATWGIIMLCGVCGLFIGKRFL